MMRFLVTLVIAGCVLWLGFVGRGYWIMANSGPSDDRTAQMIVRLAGGSVDGTLRYIEENKDDGARVSHGMFALVYLCDTDKSRAEEAAVALGGVIERIQRGSFPVAKEGPQYLDSTVWRQFLLDQCYSYMTKRADRSHNPLLLELLKNRRPVSPPDVPSTTSPSAG